MLTLLAALQVYASAVLAPALAEDAAIFTRETGTAVVFQAAPDDRTDLALADDLPPAAPALAATRLVVATTVRGHEKIRSAADLDRPGVRVPRAADGPAACRAIAAGEADAALVPAAAAFAVPGLYMIEVEPPRWVVFRSFIPRDAANGEAAYAFLTRLRSQEAQGRRFAFGLTSPPGP